MASMANIIFINRKLEFQDFKRSDLARWLGFTPTLIFQFNYSWRLGIMWQGLCDKGHRP